MISDKKARSNGNILRNLLIFALCLCVLFTLYPISSFADAEQQDQYEAAWYNESGELIYGSLEEAIGNVGADGIVMLLSDVSLAKGITVSKPMMIFSQDANAPYTIKNHMAGDVNDTKELGRIFTFTGSGNLILRNIILDGGKNAGVAAYHPLICVNGGGYLRLLEGAVLRNAENKSQSLGGGGVNIRSGQLYMYDGSMITDCKAVDGGGVEVNSKSKNYTGAMFGMAGGSVEDCEASKGGGVYVNIGQFMMQNGKITNNTATNSEYNYGGGGIYVAGERYTAAVRITGGEISDNTAVSNGGGILVNGAYALLQTEGSTLERNNADNGGGVSMLLGTMNLYGGTVTNNTAELYGGGVLGSPDSVIYLQGAPRIFGNTAKDTEDSFDNLYLDGADDYGYPTSPLRLTGALTDGVMLGMSRWVRPDDEHPYREMLVPHNGFNITQSDLDRLCCNRTDENKELYADNMEKYAFITYDGKIVMVLAVDVELDREELAFKELSDEPVTVVASVTPDNAPEKGVTWSSSDENVATVDENGKVTPVGNGTAVVTAVTKSPYHETASCSVTVGQESHQLTTKAVNGKLTFMPVGSNGFFMCGDEIELKPVADNGYEFKAYLTDGNSAEVVITDNKLIMPNRDVTVEAVFEPISYPIVYDLDGGELKEGETNPAAYTIESDEIILKKPIKNGYTFAGWTGTELTEVASDVNIPSGSTGAREYTAVWKKNVYRLTTKAEHGDIIYTTAKASEFFQVDEEITVKPVADNGYQLCSLKAYRSDDNSAEVTITDNKLTMPNHDVTVEAVFEPISYPIVYDLDGGELKEGETNPAAYTIESDEIILKKPIKNGYTFAGWTGTELMEVSFDVKIPHGSTGAREYTAVWEKATPPESSAPSGNDPEPPTDNSPSTSEESKPNIPTPPITGDIDENDPSPSDESRSDSDDPTPSESEPTESGDAPSESSGGSSNDEATQPSCVTPSTNESETGKNDSTSPGSENHSISCEREPNESEKPPATGIAVSCLPLTAAIAVVTVAAKCKKK